MATELVNLTNPNSAHSPSEEPVIPGSHLSRAAQFNRVTQAIQPLQQGRAAIGPNPQEG